MEQHGLQRLAGEFPAGGQRVEPTVHGLIDFAERSFELIFPIEDANDERAGFDRRVLLSLQMDLHVTLSLLVSNFVFFSLRQRQFERSRASGSNAFESGRWLRPLRAWLPCDART